MIASNANRHSLIDERLPVFGLLLVLAVIGVYWGTWSAPFLFDDTTAILENPTIRHLASTDVLSPPRDGSTTTGRPLVNLSFAVNYAVSGEKVQSYHGFNLAIHACAALALMGFLRRVLLSAPLRERFRDSATPLAFTIALLWALHPLQTESVICIAQRTESLCGLFFLATLYCFTRGAEDDKASAGWLALSVLSCLAGMATKEVMVSAPALVLLTDRTFFAGGFVAALRRRAFYFAALAATWILLAVLVLQGGGARGTAAGFGLGISWWNYLLTQAGAILLYLKLSIWPHPLVLDYGTDVVRSLADVWSQGLLVLTLLGATIWALVRRPLLGFAGAWFFLILAPSSSVIPLVSQTVAEHRMYLPLASVIGVVGIFLYFSIGKFAKWPLGAIVVVFAMVTIVRVRDYGDVVGIWDDTVAKSPRNSRAENNLAWALQQQGKSEAANHHFARAIDLKPDYVAAHYSWGVALLDQKKTDLAIAQFEAAVKLAPRHADAHLNLGNALMQVRRAADAIPHYEEALRLRPGADAHYNLGVALADLDRNPEARGHFLAALQDNPNLVEAAYQLGRIAERLGLFEEAETSYRDALKISPQHAAAHSRLGLVLARLNRLNAAEEELQAALKLNPKDADTFAFLGNVLLAKGLPREAIDAYERSLRLRPDDARTRENLQLAREALR